MRDLLERTLQSKWTGQPKASDGKLMSGEKAESNTAIYASTETKNLMSSAALRSGDTQILE